MGQFIAFTWRESLPSLNKTSHEGIGWIGSRLLDVLGCFFGSCIYSEFHATSAVYFTATTHEPDSFFGLSTQSIEVCFSPPCFSICCSPLPKKQPPDTTTTVTTNWTGKPFLLWEHIGGAKLLVRNSVRIMAVCERQTFTERELHSWSHLPNG